MFLLGRCLEGQKCIEEIGSEFCGGVSGKSWKIYENQRSSIFSQRISLKQKGKIQEKTAFSIEKKMSTTSLETQIPSITLLKQIDFHPHKTTNPHTLSRIRFTYTNESPPYSTQQHPDFPNQRGHPKLTRNLSGNLMVPILKMEQILQESKSSYQISCIEKKKIFTSDSLGSKTSLDDMKIRRVSSINGSTDRESLIENFDKNIFLGEYATSMPFPEKMEVE